MGEGVITLGKKLNALLNDFIKAHGLSFENISGSKTEDQNLIVLFTDKLISGEISAKKGEMRI